MSREPDYENMGAFEQILDGLKQSLSHARGGLTLKTTTLPAPAPRFSAQRVAAIRRKLGMSQAVFASYLNVPVRTLQSWEQGARGPKAGEARLLQIFETDPAAAGSLVLRGRTGAARSKPGRAHATTRGAAPAKRAAGSRARTRKRPAA